MIQALEEAGIKPDLMTGTCAASLVAALHASGRNGAQLQRTSETMDEATFTDWALPLSGRAMLRCDALTRYVHKQVSGGRIEDLAVPLGILATGLQRGQGVLFERGYFATAVQRPVP